MIRLTSLLRIALGCALLIGSPLPFYAADAAAKPENIIIDTDIGDDIDDAFALALALRSPELQIVGITTTFGDTEPAPNFWTAFWEKLAVRTSRWQLARRPRPKLH